MGNLIVKFLQEQGILIVMGLLVLEGILQQCMASRRYRRLWAGLRSLTASEPAAESQTTPRKRERRTSRRQEVGHAAPEIAVSAERRGSRRQRYLQENDRSAEMSVHRQPQEETEDLDAQLTYLKQSLDRIAAGRDQKLDEEPREHRKLTPEQEAVIADILREYLS